MHYIFDPEYIRLKEESHRRNTVAFRERRKLTSGETEHSGRISTSWTMSGLLHHLGANFSDSRPLPHRLTYNRRCYYYDAYENF